MAFLRAWLIPRTAFWILWTIWLWCLQVFMQDWLESMAGYSPLMVVGPPILLTWVGSRFARNPFDTPSALFWKGAAVSFLLGVFFNLYLTMDFGGGLIFMLLAFLLCGYMAVKGANVKKKEVKDGDLFERVRAMAQRTGVSVHRVLVFTTPKDTAAAFAQRTGAILLSDRLLRVLSRNETDAVIAHEVAHLLPRQRIVIAAVPIAVAGTTLIGALLPAARSWAPFCPLAALLLWRALRRTQEYDADATAVGVCRDGEALISALARICHISGLPMYWGRVAGIFMPHPPMTARFGAIAAKTGISSSRVEELVAAVRVVPALPGYPSPFVQSQVEDSPIWSNYCDRIQKGMAALNQVFPIAAGVAWSAVALFASPGWAGFEIVWIFVMMLLHWIAYETIAGSERQRLRRQLSAPISREKFFVGLSTAAEPRQFDNSYHYDLGLASIQGGSLKYKGARCSFCLQSSQVSRIWLAKGPPHWTPRKVVCIEYRFGDAGERGIISMQSLERWFWPGTASAASQLLAAIERWKQNGAVCNDLAVLPPHAIGAFVPRLPVSSLWKPLRISCSISLCIGWSMTAFSQADLENLFAPFWATLVTASLVLFAYAPHVDWTNSTGRQTSPQPSASASKY